MHCISPGSSKFAVRIIIRIPLVKSKEKATYNTKKGALANALLWFAALCR
jgi:hypothetical protein